MKQGIQCDQFDSKVCFFLIKKIFYRHSYEIDYIARLLYDVFLKFLNRNRATIEKTTLKLKHTI